MARRLWRGLPRSLHHSLLAPTSSITCPPLDPHSFTGMLRTLSPLSARPPPSNPSTRTCTSPSAPPSPTPDTPPPLVDILLCTICATPDPPPRPHLWPRSSRRSRWMPGHLGRVCECVCWCKDKSSQTPVNALAAAGVMSHPSRRPAQPFTVCGTVCAAHPASRPHCLSPQSALPTPCLVHPAPSAARREFDASATSHRRLSLSFLHPTPSSPTSCPPSPPPPDPFPCTPVFVGFGLVWAGIYNPPSHSRCLTGPQPGLDTVGSYRTCLPAGSHRRCLPVPQRAPRANGCRAHVFVGSGTQTRHVLK